MTDLQIFKNAPHDVSAEELKSYLDGACGGDATLRSRVEGRSSGQMRKLADS